VVFLDDLGVNLKPARTLGMRTIKVTDPDQALKELEQVLEHTLSSSTIEPTTDQPFIEVEPLSLGPLTPVQADGKPRSLGTGSDQWNRPPQPGQGQR
jgi:hypothetical protein